MYSQTLGFIGGGNMARSLIGGLISSGALPARIIVAEPNEQQRSRLQQDYGVRVSANNAECAAAADVVILAVKPQDMQSVTSQIAGVLTERHLLISVAAGIRIASLQQWASGTRAIVRCMPNRPALQACGVTGLFAATEVTDSQREMADTLLKSVGETVWLTEESQMDAVTAVSGSGPAYFFLLIEMLEAAGRELGLPSEVSHTLAVETAYGAGRMARESHDDAAELRRQVTSKGGTTEAALNHLESQRVRAIFAAAIAAAAKRSAELADQLGR